MKLYFKFFSMHLKSRMSYKKSFFMSIVGQFLFAFSAFLTMYFLLSRFGSINGYTMDECLLSAGVMWSSFSLAECFFRGFDLFPGIIRRAEFDRILVRPRGLIFQVLCQQIEFARLGKLIQALVMLIWGVRAAPVVWTPLRCVTLALMILGGFAVFCSLFLLYAAISFFTLEGLEFMNCFTDGAREHGVYPLDVYGPSVLKFCTYVIPYALFQYYPLLYLLGRAPASHALLPLLAPVFAIPCYGLWRFGVRRYKSAGS